MKLKDAIQGQIDRLTEEKPVMPVDTETSDLLMAFKYFINAYLQRINRSEEETSNMVSPMDVKRGNTFTDTFATTA